MTEPEEPLDSGLVDAEPVRWLPHVAMALDIAAGRELATHELKCCPEFFEKIGTGVKRFELRVDDRGFRAGHRLRLREWRRDREEYTGREIAVVVLYLVSGLGLQKDWVCMSLSDPLQCLSCDSIILAPGDEFCAACAVHQDHPDAIREWP